MIKNCCEKKSEKMKEILKLKEFLKIVSDVNRLRILCLLSGGERCVCEIFGVLKLPQNLVSHHLTKLKELKLVQERRERTFIFYNLNKKTLRRFKLLFNQIMK